MTVSELLRRLANVIDELNPPVNDSSDEPVGQTMVSPQQQELELAKLDKDVSNAFDKDGELSALKNDDELDQLKYAAGLTTDCKGF